MTRLQTVCQWHVIQMGDHMRVSAAKKFPGMSQCQSHYVLVDHTHETVEREIAICLTQIG